jgi:hypothetical protein
LVPAVAKCEVGVIRLDNWTFFQSNENDTNELKYWPRLFIPFHLDNGWEFTQRFDMPMVYSKDVESGEDASYSGGLSGPFIEEIFDTPQVRENLSLRTSLRVVFPATKPAQFGTREYQVAWSAGFRYEVPDTLNGVSLSPLARYFWGFSPSEPSDDAPRLLTLFPTVEFRLDETTTMSFYSENPITFNSRTNAWFLPLDIQFSKRISERYLFGLGGAVNLNQKNDSSYRFLLDAHFSVNF